MSAAEKWETPSFQKWLLLAATEAIELDLYNLLHLRYLLGFTPEPFPGATEMLSLVLANPDADAEQKATLSQAIIHGESVDSDWDVARASFILALRDLISMEKSGGKEKAWDIAQRVQRAARPLLVNAKAEREAVFLGFKTLRFDRNGNIVLGSGAEIVQEAREMWIKHLLNRIILHESMEFSPHWIERWLPILPLDALVQKNFDDVPGATSLANLWLEWGMAPWQYESEGEMTTTPFLTALIEQLTRHLSTVTWEEIFAFSALVEEYNLEWALAAMEWSDGEDKQ